MKYLFVTLIAALGAAAFHPAAAQPLPTHTVSGKVTDAATGEALIGCTLFDRQLNRGATTNAYGFYSLTLPAGNVLLEVAYVGYEPLELQLKLVRDTALNLSLDVSAVSIGEVRVVGDHQSPLTAKAGAVNVPLSRIRNTPALFGESDLMKSLQYIPGVQGGTEGKSDLSVRGGSPDQNLILLDGNPVYNANHLFGFVSVFNTDALKNVTLYKSGFPARFGGRLSSVIDIHTKDGNKERFGGSATMGLLTAKFNVEGPIVRNKTSFTLSGRRSWADLFMGALQRSADVVTTLWFYDLNAKIHHRLSDRTSIYLTAYNGRDKLNNTEQHNGTGAAPADVASLEQEWRWGNTLAAVRLNSALTGNLFLNANLSYNRYQYSTWIGNNRSAADEAGSLQQVRNRIDYNSGIRDYTAVLELEYIPVPAHYIRTGAQYVRHDFRPETLSLAGEVNRNVAGGKIPAGEFSLYAEDEWEVLRRLTLNGGVRFSLFNVHGKSYSGIDPRLSARFLLSGRVSVKAAYTRMQQYIHLLSNNALIFQTDLWVPATGRVKPMHSTQYSIGVYAAFPKLFDLSAEGYYKDMNRVIEYQDGASFSGSSSGWEEKVETGVGRSYGGEVSLERHAGGTTGALSYAWSKSERKFDNIDYGAWFPAKYDRRHSINATVTQKLSPKADLTISWRYASGEMMTLPMMSAEVPHVEGGVHTNDLHQLDHRNNYRTPAYHRLDAGINLYPRKSRHPQRYGVWNFSIYNLYNRMNAFKLYADTFSQEQYPGKLMKITLFPLLPSVSYTCHF
ncbi:MAG: TonB-dependent receptor [Culturomica sp.]|jgi:outer membrane receptor for ferrienterochelin and colicin|nr:TonB-dependent receptor [Culturomica sp.]